MADEPQKPAAETTAPAPEATPAPAAPVTSPESPQAPAPVQPAELKLSDLAGIAKTYPRALDFADKIEAKAKERGMSVADAALIVLHENNALTVAPAAPAGPTTTERSSGFGGSMDTPVDPQRPDPQPGTPEAISFYADRFKELEAKGEIRLS